MNATTIMSIAATIVVFTFSIYFLTKEKPKTEEIEPTVDNDLPGTDI